MKICAHCGSLTVGEWHRPGSDLLEILLWVFFLLPGLLYTLMRSSQKKFRCSVCGAPDPIPADSPRAQEFLDHYHKPGDLMLALQKEDDSNRWLFAIFVAIAVGICALWLSAKYLNLGRQ